MDSYPNGSEMICWRILPQGRAFTLIEMLVIVAISILLLSLLLPALNGARRKAQAAGCASNMGQLFIACEQYSADNAGVLIPICVGTGAQDGQTWRLLLDPYLGKHHEQVLRCPADRAAQGQTMWSGGINPSSYGINKYPKLHQYLTDSSRTTATLAAVSHASKTVFLSEIGIVDNPSLAPSAWTQTARFAKPNSYSNFGYCVFPSAAQWGPFPYHGDGHANMLFYDGHVESVDLAADILAQPAGTPGCLYDNH